MKIQKKIISLFVAVTMLAPIYNPAVLAQNPDSPSTTSFTGGQSDHLSQQQLASLVSPIALYPDSLLSQVLMASTYPLEVAEAGNWISQNANLKGDDFANALKQQNWDPSVKSLTTFPDTLKMMNQNLNWTQQLGNAFLAQQEDVMSAVQTLRGQSQKAGTLKTTSQQKVTTQQQNGQSVIIIEPSNPQVVYVPSYNPVVVYGSAWPYPAYPPPPVYPPGYVAGVSLLSFSAGIAVGAALWGGCNWHSNSVIVNNNTYNSYNRQTYNNYKNNYDRYKNGHWQHNPDHRGNVPYANRQLQNKYGQNESKLNSERQKFKQNEPKEFQQTKQNAQQKRTTGAHPERQGQEPLERNLEGKQEEGRQSEQKIGHEGGGFHREGHPSFRK